MINNVAKEKDRKTQIYIVLKINTTAILKVKNLQDVPESGCCVGCGCCVGFSCGDGLGTEMVCTML